jgi:hypothetical protein
VRYGYLRFQPVANLHGMKVGKLAKKYRIHRVTVADHLAIHGFAKRVRGLDETQVLDAADRYQAGASLAVLGKKYGGVSPQFDEP